MPSPAPDAVAIAVAHRLYRFRPTAAVRLRSENNAVFRVEFGGLPAKVVKIGRRVAGVKREQRVLRILARPRWGLAVPKVEFTQDDLPERWQDGSGIEWSRPEAVTVTRHEPGMTLADAALRGEAFTASAFQSAGAFAAHEVPVQAVRPEARRRQLPREVSRSMNWAAEAAREAGCEAETAAALAEVARIKQCETFHLVHGEMYPENVRVMPGGTGLVVLDWESARPGSPASDLAQLTTWPLVNGLDEATAASLRAAAAEGFFALRPGVDPSEWRAWEVFWLLCAARYSGDRRLAEAAVVSSRS